MRWAGLAAFGALALIAGEPALAGMGPAERKAPPVAGRLETLREIAPALAKCWAPPAIEGVGEITVRLSFDRMGAIIGAPRISYSRAVGPEQQQRLKQSLLVALARCAPLPVSSRLGAAIAGRIFAIRFIVSDQKGQNI